MKFPKYRISNLYRKAAENKENFDRAYYLALEKGFKPPSKRKYHYQFIQITPLESYVTHMFGNDGMQAWRHLKTGYAFPDINRLRGQPPNAWHRMPIGKLVRISNIEQLIPYIVERR